MEDRVNVGMLQGHMMEVQQHNTTAEYRSNIRIAEDKREIADCVKSLDISFDRENICNLKRDDDDDEHIPPRPKKQKLVSNFRSIQKINFVKCDKIYM